MRRFWHSLRRIPDQLTEAQWDILRVLLVVLALGGVGALGYFGGWPVWQRWQVRRSLAQAQVFAQTKDYRSLMLALRRATQEAPENPMVWRQIVQILAEIGSPDTVMALQQAARLQPQDMALRLALVQEALKFDRLDTAQSALAKMEYAARRDVAFHRLAAALALALGRTADLKRQLAAVIAGDPRDLDARFTYATMQLWSEDPAEASAGRTELGALTFEPSVRIRAAIELLTDAARRRDAAQMQRLVVRLLAIFAPGTRADFSSADPPAWRALLQGMRTAAAEPTDAALLAQWLAGLGQRREAIAWLGRLPGPVRDAAIVRDTAAELNAEEGNLDALEGLLRGGAWGPVPGNAVTLALAARVQQTSFDDARGRATWNDAIAACQGSPGGLRALARMAEAWRDPSEREAALQTLVQRDPKAFWAYEALRNSYAARQDLPDLWRLYRAWSLQMPDDAELAAQEITLGCILGHGSSEISARAARLAAAAPASPTAAIAYAAALWRQGADNRAWSVLAARPEAERQQPAMAFWVALVQADLGNAAAAAAALDLAYRGDLGGEQLELLRLASAKVGYPPPR